MPALQLIFPPSYLLGGGGGVKIQCRWKACVLPQNFFKLQSMPFLLETWTGTLASYCMKWPLEQLHLTPGESEAGCGYWGQEDPLGFTPGEIRMTFGTSAGVQASC